MTDIAIIGTGIAGLGAAAGLCAGNDLTIYEKNGYAGGHARTLVIDYDGVPIAVDTGFIVFNYRNYPHLATLFGKLNVPVQKSVMSFAVRSDADDLEWGAENLWSLFGQRRNLWRPEFHRFLFDVLAFNRRARGAVARDPAQTMGDLLKRLGLSDWFTRFYILPMGGAIWSCPLQDILGFPARSFVDFFDAHGLLTVTQQPQWYTVTGGSQVYVAALTRRLGDSLRLNRGAVRVARAGGRVAVTDTHGETRMFDHVVMACHADEALAMLERPDAAETSVLGAFRYQKNIAILHKSPHLMPKRRACWASWVYHAASRADRDPVAVTYWMNHLQNIDARYPLFLSLNPRQPPAESDIFDRHEFTHPVYDRTAIDAQARIPDIQGRGNVWFCGAWQRNGFHEDGLASAHAMAEAMRVRGVGVAWD